ncbi:MAG: Arm DNA-binding domain-containing protein [Parvularculaceae bacterium]|nr:Arm DNA-binding domain-containing protein [Parvularculaceae bacterium]
MSPSQMAVRNAAPKDKDNKLTDSDGMLLFVRKTGSKYWR